MLDDVDRPRRRRRKRRRPTAGTVALIVLAAAGVGLFLIAAFITLIIVLGNSF